jgi:hypothetical protein
MQILTNEVNFGKVLLNTDPVNYITHPKSWKYSLEITSDIYPFSIKRYNFR